MNTIALPELAVLASVMVTASFTIVNASNAFLETMENGLFIQNIRTFLEYKEKIPEDYDGILPEKEIKSIEFRNVSFAYNDKNLIIKNISFKIEGKTTVAFAGYNGAGKSTIIKLLFRLYDPTEGEIFVNNINIKNYNLKAYRKLFSAAFQDFKIMAFSITDNILMGREDAPEKISEALKKAGLSEKIASLKKGADTIITKEFDKNGAVLSGGELQKIAIARTFAYPTPIKVFDEPSSALDPVAEHEMFQTILHETAAHTVIFISHRLSSVKSADMVFMLQNGEIIERGSHSELMEKNGEYAKMYNIQAKNYLAL
jgi:ATP-binding cassette subfamily B protein